MVGETSGIPDPSCETMSFLSKLFVRPNVSSSRPRFQPKTGLAGIPARASQGFKTVIKFKHKDKYKYSYKDKYKMGLVGTPA